MSFHLRPYQQNACTSIMQEFQKGIQKTLLILPTGCGKTVVFNGIAFRFAYNPNRLPSGGRVLILAHQNILIDQAADKFRSIMGIEVSKEKGKQTCIGSEYPITVSSMQTMQRRIHKFDPDYFDLIIIDEAHHCMSKGYQQLLSHFTGAKVLGVTATPDRADGKKLECFQSIAFSYKINEAIRDGYLSEYIIAHPKLSIDLSNVKSRMGDLAEDQIGQAIEPHLDEIANVVSELCQGRRIVCFVPLIRTAQKAKEIFEEHGFRAEWTAGADKDREGKLADFAAGKFDILFNSMLLTEGWDCPETDCVIVLRPTRSRALYTQMIGRGLRLAEGKKNCLLVDFLYLYSRHPLASPEDVLGINKPKEKGRKGGAGNVSDAEESLIKQLNEARNKGSGLKDPHQDPRWKDILRNADTGDWDGPPSKKQREVLEKNKIDPECCTFREASAIIGELFKVTPKQRWFLQKHGFDKEKIDAMTKAQAGKVIASIKR